jgi:hypothetical protein
MAHSQKWFQRVAPNEKSRRALKQFLWIIVAISIFVSLVPTFPYVFPKSRWAYALAYDTDEEYVHIGPEPRDCDFFYAPIGDKGCHYEREVSVARAVTPPGRPFSPLEVYVSWSRVSQ